LLHLFGNKLQSTAGLMPSICINLVETHATSEKLKKKISGLLLEFSLFQIPANALKISRAMVCGNAIAFGYLHNRIFHDIKKLFQRFRRFLPDLFNLFNIFSFFHLVNFFSHCLVFYSLWFYLYLLNFLVSLTFLIFSVFIFIFLVSLVFFLSFLTFYTLEVTKQMQELVKSIYFTTSILFMGASSFNYLRKLTHF